MPVTMNARSSLRINENNTIWRSDFVVFVGQFQWTSLKAHLFRLNRRHELKAERQIWKLSTVKVEKWFRSSRGTLENYSRRRCDTNEGWKQACDAFWRMHRNASFRHLKMHCLQFCHVLLADVRMSRFWLCNWRHSPQ